MGLEQNYPKTPPLSPYQGTMVCASMVSALSAAGAGGKTEEIRQDRKLRPPCNERQRSCTSSSRPKALEMNICGRRI